MDRVSARDPQRTIVHLDDCSEISDDLAAQISKKKQEWGWRLRPTVALIMDWAGLGHTTPIGSNVFVRVASIQRPTAITAHCGENGSINPLFERDFGDRRSLTSAVIAIHWATHVWQSAVRSGGLRPRKDLPIKEKCIKNSP